MSAYQANEEEEMETMEWDIRRMEAELREWGVRLDKLVAKADGARSDGKLDYRSRLDNLRTRCIASASLAHVFGVSPIHRRSAGNVNRRIKMDGPAPVCRVTAPATS